MGLLKKSGNMGFVGVYCINPLGNRIKQGVCDTPLHQNLDYVCFSTVPKMSVLQQKQAKNYFST